MDEIRQKLASCADTADWSVSAVIAVDSACPITPFLPDNVLADSGQLTHDSG